MLSALLGAASALVDGSRSAVLRRASAPRCAATDCPLSNLNCPFGTTSPPAPPPSAAVAESLERVAESLESSLQSSLGIERPPPADLRKRKISQVDLRIFVDTFRCLFALAIVSGVVALVKRSVDDY